MEEGKACACVRVHVLMLKHIREKGSGGWGERLTAQSRLPSNLNLLQSSGVGLLELDFQV